MKRVHTWAVAAVMITCSGAGCGGAVQRTQEAAAIATTTDAVPLRVQNNNPADVKIFVVVGGTWKYIGFVASRSSDNFELGALDRTGAPLRILATPVGGWESARSEPLTVFPGQIVTFTIEADLALSSALVR
jgi:hypothetical protein